MMVRRHSAGFSLIELSISLGVIALIMGFAITMGGNALKSAERVNTQERMKVLQLAIESYARANGYLPCPSNRALTPSGNRNAFGLEVRNGTTCQASAPGIVQVGNGFIGGVPVRTLGLPDAYAADAWKNKFTYAVSSTLVSGADSYSINDAQLTVRYGDRTGTNNYPVTTAVNRATNPPTFSAGAGASYVVISHGKDGRGAFPQAATARRIACGNGAQNDVENCDDSNLIFYDTDYNDGRNAATFFDDYIFWGSNALQRTPISTSGYDCASLGKPCEAWCAQCYPNLTIANSNMPADPSSITDAKLCQKVVTSLSPCTASCVWSGTYEGNYVKCP